MKLEKKSPFCIHYSNNWFVEGSTKRSRTFASFQSIISPHKWLIITKRNVVTLQWETWGEHFDQVITTWSEAPGRHLEVLDSSAQLFMPKMTTWMKLGGNFKQTYLRDFVRQSFKNIKVMKEKKDLRTVPDWETKETWHVNEMHDPRLGLASGETIVMKDIIGIIGEICIWTVFQIIVLYGC